MEVDHLAANVHGHHIRVLADVETQTAIEGDHRVGVLHRQRDMVEPADFTALLCAKPDASSRAADSNQRFYEPPTGCFRVHGDLTLPHKWNETMPDTFLVVAVP